MSHLKETLEVEDTPRHMAFDAPDRTGGSL